MADAFNKGAVGAGELARILPAVTDELCKRARKQSAYEASAIALCATRSMITVSTMVSSNMANMPM